MSIRESIIEDTAFSWFAEFGYTIAHCLGVALND